MLPTMPERICAGPECGNILSPDSRATTIHCSSSCRYRSYRRRKFPRPPCAQCSLAVPIGRKKFCSDDCYHQYRIDNGRALHIYFDCKYCGGLLPLDRRADRKYCDDICRILWNEDHRPHRGWRKPPAYTHCDTCGNPLPAKRNANRKYCNALCKKQAYREDVRANAHPA